MRHRLRSNGAPTVQATRMRSSRDVIRPTMRNRVSSDTALTVRLLASNAWNREDTLCEHRTRVSTGAWRITRNVDDRQVPVRLGEQGPLKRC